MHLSSAAACINVLGSMMHDPDELKNFLNQFDLEIEDALQIPYQL